MPTHDYRKLASRYAQRGLVNSDYLAFRVLPEVFSRLGVGGTALDHGCGTGRSTRFLESFGLRVVGVDRAPLMLEQAKREHPAGDYRLVTGGALPFPNASFDLVFSSYVLLEQSTEKELRNLIGEGARVLKDGRHLVVVTNTPEFYQGTWVSCEVNFPENAEPLRSGQKVRVRLVPEGVELLDTFWADSDYKEAFARAGLVLVGEHRPLGRTDDGIKWRDETHTAPYVVYVLRKKQPAEARRQVLTAKLSSPTAR